jgi:uncharacterized caspase-like protein
MTRLVAVVVGCDYENSPQPALPVLSGAENDARSVAALLADHDIAGGMLAHLTLLLGAEATTARIRQALRQARSAQAPDDTLLFYFAGHGSRDAHGLTLHTWDATYLATALIADFGKRPKTTNIILDCCHAGAVAAALDDQMLMLKYTTGKLYFLCGAAAAQTAGEALGHGLFTQTLVKVLARRRQPPLLGLPIDLDRWCKALPAELRANFHDLKLDDISRGGLHVFGEAAAAPVAGQRWGIER